MTIQQDGFNQVLPSATLGVSPLRLTHANCCFSKELELEWNDLTYNEQAALDDLRCPRKERNHLVDKPGYDYGFGYQQSPYGKVKELTGSILDRHQCFSKADEYGISSNDVKKAARQFCEKTMKSYWDGRADRYDEKGEYGTWSSVYHFGETTAIEMAMTNIKLNCTGGWDNEDVDAWWRQTNSEMCYRDQGPDCYQLLYGAWKQCYHNGGRGGAVDYNNARYIVRPYFKKSPMVGKKASWAASPQDKAIYAGAGPDILNDAEIKNIDFSTEWCGPADSWKGRQEDNWAHG